MPFELFLALRYLVARRKQAFLSLISVILDGGRRGWVMASIIVLALMTGLQGELRDRIVGASPHIYVWHVGEGLTDVQGDMRRLKQGAASDWRVADRAWQGARHGGGAAGVHHRQGD